MRSGHMYGSLGQRPAHALSCQYTADQNDPATDVLSAFIHTKITAAHMECMPNLRLIATRATDLTISTLRWPRLTKSSAAKCRSMANAPSPIRHGVVARSHRTGAAQHLPPVVRFSANVKGLRSVDILGKTVGIVGTRHEGRSFGRLAAITPRYCWALATNCTSNST